MSLSELRKQIDAIDREWILLIKRRLEVAKQIARIKKRDCTPILDREREREMLTGVLRQAQELEMNPQRIEELFCLMLDFTKQEMGQGVKNLQ